MKRLVKFKIGAYEAEVQDYRYKSRAPVSVRVSGTVDGVSIHAPARGATHLRR